MPGRLLLLCLLSSSALAETPPPGLPTELAPLPPGTLVTPNWVDWELGSMMRYFAQQTGMNLVLDDEKDLAQTVTVIGNTPVPVEQAFEAFVMALQAKGFVLVEGAGFTRIARSDEAARWLSIDDGAEIPDSWSFMTHLVQLQHVPVSEVEPLIASLIGPNGKHLMYLPTNTILLTDSGVNLRKLVAMLRELDKEAPRTEMTVHSLEFARASEVASLIEQLVGVNSKPSAAPAPKRSKGRATQQASVAPATRAGAAPKYISKVLADERTNSIVLMANAEGRAVVERFIAELDIDVDRTAQIHAIHLEHADAANVVQVLSGLQQGSGGTQPKKAGSGTAAKPGSTGVVAALDSGMRITHDADTNTIIVVAPPDEFAIVADMIAEIDVLRRQVFVDVVILEIAGDDDFNMGLGAHTATPGGGVVGMGLDANSVVGLTQNTLAGLALGAFGPTVEVPVGGQLMQVPAFGVVLHALKTNSSVHVVSNPHLLSLDNEEAEIVVGKKIPFPTTSGVNPLTGQPIPGITREEVAIRLSVKPRINSGELVTLTVDIGIEEVEPGTSASISSTGALTTVEKGVVTTLLAGHDQTVVLGGLVANTETVIEKKVPLLGDLPLLGLAFRKTQRIARRSNLLVFLTPHIIDDHADIAEVMAVKEAQRQEFVRRFHGKTQEEQEAQMRELLQFAPAPQPAP